MVRIIILVVIGLLSFSIVFGLGYLFIVPRTSMMEEEMQPLGDMELVPEGDMDDPGEAPGEAMDDPGEAPEVDMEDPGEAPESN